MWRAADELQQAPYGVQRGFDAERSPRVPAPVTVMALLWWEARPARARGGQARPETRRAPQRFLDPRRSCIEPTPEY